MENRKMSITTYMVPTRFKYTCIFDDRKFDSGFFGSREKAKKQLMARIVLFKNNFIANVRNPEEEYEKLNLDLEFEEVTRSSKYVAEYPVDIEGVNHMFYSNESTSKKDAEKDVKVKAAEFLFKI